jgi:small subunit ribosomal protein S8
VWSDPIADFLTRIRNAIRVRKKEVRVPHSRMKAAIAKVLKDEGYILGYDRIENENQGILRIELKYGARGEQVIHSLKRESTGGRRVYRKVSDLPSVLDGLGICVVSTSRGVLSDRACREQKVGGELVCTVF